MTSAVRPAISPTVASPAAPAGVHLSLLIAEPPRAIEISAVHSATFTDGWSTEAIEGLLSDPGALAFVGKIAGEPGIAGFIIARLVADEAEILSVGVSPEHQRKGVATKMVAGVIRALERAECKRVYLEVAVDNEPARALYDRAGFVAVGLRRGYYQRPTPGPVDGLTLSRTI